MKHTIEGCRDIAKEKGGRCISEIYVANYKPIEWECKDKHRWFARFKDILDGRWCPKCAKVSRVSFDDLCMFAKNNGFFCKSKKEEYKNTRSKIVFECKNGHVFEKKVSKFRSKPGCKFCSGHVKPTIEDCRNVAKDKGFVCVSQKYVSANIKLEWKCSKGHVWPARYNDIKQGSGCPKCYRMCFDDFVKKAKERNGMCLSKKEYFKNSSSILRWRCSEGHEWNAMASNILYRD